MKKILLGLAMGIMLVVTACTSTPNKANIAELTQKGEFIMLNGSKFTGTATDTENLMTLTLKDGVVKEIIARYGNGNIAMQSDDEGFAFFNPDGYQIDERMFFQKYFSVQERVDSVLNQIRIQK